TRVPLGSFTLASLLISALYLPLMLYLVIVFGDAMDDHVGLWAWPLMLVAVAIIGFGRNRIFRFGSPAPTPAAGRPLAPRARYSEAFSRKLVDRLAVQPNARWFRSLRTASKSRATVRQ